MDKELTSLLEGIETANNIQQYEEGFLGDVGNLAKNAVKNVATNAKNAVVNTAKNVGNKVAGAVATAAANQQNKQNEKNNQQANTEADQALVSFANKVSQLLTQGATGDMQKKADNANENAKNAKAGAKDAKKELDAETEKTPEQLEAEGAVV